MKRAAVCRLRTRSNCCFPEVRTDLVLRALAFLCAFILGVFSTLDVSSEEPPISSGGGSGVGNGGSVKRAQMGQSASRVDRAAADSSARTSTVPVRVQSPVEPDKALQQAATSSSRRGGGKAKLGGPLMRRQESGASQAPTDAPQGKTTDE